MFWVRIFSVDDARYQQYGATPLGLVVLLVLATISLLALIVSVWAWNREKEQSKGQRLMWLCGVGIFMLLRPIYDMVMDAPGQFSDGTYYEIGPVHKPGEDMFVFFLIMIGLALWFGLCFYLSAATFKLSLVGESVDYSDFSGDRTMTAFFFGLGFPLTITLQLGRQLFFALKRILYD